MSAYCADDKDDTVKYTCKKCRTVLFTASNLVNEHGGLIGSAVNACSQETSNAVSDSSTLWFLNERNLPDWMEILVNLANWIKGKLLCPKCNTRVGSFDFVNGSKCECGLHVLPPVHVAKTKVDTKDKNAVDFMRRPSGLHTLVAENSCGEVEKHEIEASKEVIN